MINYLGTASSLVKLTASVDSFLWRDILIISDSEPDVNKIVMKSRKCKILQLKIIGFCTYTDVTAFPSQNFGKLPDLMKCGLHNHKNWNSFGLLITKQEYNIKKLIKV